MKKFLLAVLGVLIIIAAIVLIKTFTYPFKKNTIVSGEGWKPVKTTLQSCGCQGNQNTYCFHGKPRNIQLCSVRSV